jgi:hypothetical protein
MYLVNTESNFEKVYANDAQMPNFIPSVTCGTITWRTHSLISSVLAFYYNM